MIKHGKVKYSALRARVDPKACCCGYPGSFLRASMVKDEELAEYGPVMTRNHYCVQCHIESDEYGTYTFFDVYSNSVGNPFYASGG